MTASRYEPGLSLLNRDALSTFTPYYGPAISARGLSLFLLCSLLEHSILQ